MINNYNRRKQGIEYLQHVLSPILDKVIALDLKLELNPRQVCLSLSLSLSSSRRAFALSLHICSLSLYHAAYVCVRPRFTKLSSTRKK
jgi:hypothetical protein